MRVLMLTEVFHPDVTGGAGRVAAELARVLAGKGAEVRVITRQTPRAMQTTEDRHGYRIYRYPADLSSPIAAYRSTHRGVIASIDAALDGFHPDILDIHQPHIAYHALGHPPLTGIPAVYTFHSSWPDEMKIRGGMHGMIAPVATRIEKEVFRHLAHVVVLSEFSRRRCAEINSRTPATIIPGGVDTVNFPVKPQASRNDPPVFLTIRNLVKRMGIDSLITAVKILKAEGQRIRLEIGGTGPLAEDLKKKAEPLGGDCAFLGHIPEKDLAACYRKADLFVLPTVAIEGFGLVILEAFASGTPVIGTPVGAIPEMVGLQGHGYVSETSQPEDIARALGWFLNRPDKPSPGELRKIAELHDWTNRGERMMELYKAIVD